MMSDLHDNILCSHAMAPVAANSGTTAVVSTVLDLEATTCNQVEFVAIFGAIGNGTFTALVEDSPDNSTWTTVDPSQLLGTITLAPAVNQTWKIGYIGLQRYVRVTITPVGNSAAIYLAAAWIQHGLRKQPKSTQLN